MVELGVATEERRRARQERGEGGLKTGVDIQPEKLCARKHRRCNLRKSGAIYKTRSNLSQWASTGKKLRKRIVKVISEKHAPSSTANATHDRNIQTHTTEIRLPEGIVPHSTAFRPAIPSAVALTVDQKTLASVLVVPGTARPRPSGEKTCLQQTQQTK